MTLFFIAIAFNIICVIALTCCGYDKKVPVNYALLFLFTFCNGWNMSFVCLHSKPLVVMEAALLTTAVVLGITFYACTTKSDFTYMGAYLYCAGMIFSMGCLLMCLLGYHVGLLQAIDKNCVGFRVYLRCHPFLRLLSLGHPDDHGRKQEGVLVWWGFVYFGGDLHLPWYHQHFPLYSWNYE